MTRLRSGTLIDELVKDVSTQTETDMNVQTDTESGSDSDSDSEQETDESECDISNRISDDILCDVSSDILFEIDHYIQSNQEQYANPNFHEDLTDIIYETMYEGSLLSGIFESDTEKNQQAMTEFVKQNLNLYSQLLQYPQGRLAQLWLCSLCWQLKTHW